MSIMVYADSTAALGIVRRKGAGKLRHVKIGMLWLQDVREEEPVKFEKVAGSENPADLMTKATDLKTQEKHLAELRLEEQEGRAKKSSELSKGINSFGLVRRWTRTS